MNYVLISFYNRGRSDTDQRWVIYGHRGIGDNDLVGEEDTREKALIAAHKFGVPVFQGYERTEGFIRKLSV